DLICFSLKTKGRKSLVKQSFFCLPFVIDLFGDPGPEQVYIQENSFFPVPSGLIFSLKYSSIRLSKTRLISRIALSVIFPAIAALRFSLVFSISFFSSICVIY